MRIPRFAFLVALAAVLLVPASRSETPEAKASRMAWFEAARFGMFIHWGIYSEAAGNWNGQPEKGAGEWIMERMKIPTSQYGTMIPKFDPEKFNAAEWVGIAKHAGMKYLVITSKHHDGFAMWPTSVRPGWSIGATPFHRDPLKELAAECRKQGIVFCLYYSIMDWRNPNYAPRRAWNDLAAQEGPTDYERYREELKTELKEIITSYGPLGILWFDGEWEPTWTHADAVDLEHYVRSLQPSIIINNRIDNTRAGMHGMSKDQNALGDYGTPEQQIPPQGFGPGVAWESCMTMNGTWGFKSSDHNWKSTQILIHNLVDCSSKGGNFLLNVGPTAEGVIPEASQDRLAQMGAWLKANGESIYGTQASPYSQAFAWGRCTSTPAALYLHIFDWPKDGKLSLPALAGHTAASAEVLGAAGAKVDLSQSPAGIALTVAAVTPDPNDTVIKLTWAAE